MREYVWLLPAIFIFHDMGEVVGFINCYKSFIDEKYPRISRVYANTSAEGFAIKS